MSFLIGRGRYAREAYPQPGAGGSAAAISPLSRVFYVGANNSGGVRDGSIANPFIGPQEAVNAIPAPVSAIDRLIPWLIIMAPGLYPLVADTLTLPASRSIGLCTAGFGNFSLMGTSAFLANAAGVGPGNIVQPVSLVGGTSLTLQGIVAGQLTVDSSIDDGSTASIGISRSLVAFGLTTSGAKTCTVETTIREGAQIGDIVAGLNGTFDNVVVDFGQAGNVTANGIIGDDVFLTSLTLTGAVLSHLGDSQIGGVRTPTNLGAVLRLDSCEITGGAAQPAIGQYLFDAATMRSLIQNAGSGSVQSLALGMSTADATGGQISFTNAGPGPIVLGSTNPATPTLNLYNVVKMTPGGATTITLPAASEWEAPAEPVSRLLIVMNRGTAAITVVPIGGDTSDVAVINAGETAFMTPNGTNWEKILLV